MRRTDDVQYSTAEAGKPRGNRVYRGRESLEDCAYNSAHRFRRFRRFKHDRNIRSENSVPAACLIAACGLLPREAKSRWHLLVDAVHACTVVYIQYIHSYILTKYVGVTDIT